MTKSRKRMLLSSIAMLLVALVALGSATYAWFTVNKVVSADTMKVQAAVADGLVITNKISHSAKGDWGAVAHFADESTSLYAASLNVPAASGGAIDSTATLTSATTMLYPKDVKVGGEYSANGYNNGPTASEFTSTTLVNKTAYAQNATLAFASSDYSTAYTFWVASSGEAMSNKTITAAINATSTTTHDTDSKDGTTYIKAALCDSTGKVIGFWNEGGYSPITAASPVTVGAAAANAKTTDITALNNGTVPAYSGEALAYTLYVWVEGNDPDCSDTHPNYDANFTVTFTLAD